MLGRQHWQLLHVEKDKQVIRLGKHKLQHLESKYLRGCVRPLRIVPRKNISFAAQLCLVFNTPAFVVNRNLEIFFFAKI
jgi:hypothetical protein